MLSRCFVDIVALCRCLFVVLRRYNYPVRCVVEVFQRYSYSACRVVGALFVAARGGWRGNSQIVGMSACQFLTCVPISRWVLEANISSSTPVFRCLILLYICYYHRHSRPRRSVSAERRGGTVNTCAGRINGPLHESLAGHLGEDYSPTPPPCQWAALATRAHPRFVLSPPWS